MGRLARADKILSKYDYRYAKVPKEDRYKIRDAVSHEETEDLIKIGRRARRKWKKVFENPMEV